MNWRLVLGLSALGVVMGIAAVLGWLQHREGIGWIVVWIVSAIAIARKAPRAHFMHGFWTGLLAGVLSPLVQLVLLPTYLANSPEVARQLQQLPAGWNPRVLLLAFAPVLGLAGAVALGLLSWVAAKLVRR